MAKWGMLMALGAFHGVNPGMGWLFAVALGMQERSRGAVLRALLPLGVGHALAVAFAVGAAVAIGFAMPVAWLRWPIAGALMLLGVARLFRHHHPRWARMRVSMGGLTLWSFMMATAHGAGLMVVPVFMGMSMAAGHPSTMLGADLSLSTAGHAHHMPDSGAGAALLATGVHAIGYLTVTAILSVLVFDWLGVGVLRRAWINLDLIWSAALIATGILTMML